MQLLFETHAERVLAYALRRTSPDDAPEVVAEVFLVTWRRLEDVPDDAVPWLLGVARRVISNQRRASDRRTALTLRLKEGIEREPSATVDPATEVTAHLTLVDALSRLGKWDQEALMLVAWDHLDTRRAAASMGCSTSTFSVRLHRARKRLAKVLAEDSRPRHAIGLRPTLEETE
ncbi:MAG: RNA polymerase sigma factor [Actinomycetota bacterium]